MRKPDIVGKSAKAWRFQGTPEERARKPHGLDAYVVHQPGVHMMWSWWLVTGCDLYEDTDPTQWGRLPPIKDAADKTHEFVCYALNPTHYNGSYPPDGWDATDEQGDSPTRVGRNLLTPQEFVHQETLADNDHANEILRLFVRAVCDGYTATDADFRSRNIAMLSATAQHFREGKHNAGD